MHQQDFLRLANNFYTGRGIEVKMERIAVDIDLINYLAEHTKDLEKKYKVALLCICLNEPYWPFAKQMISSAKQFFLPGHQTDFYFWTDMTPEKAKEFAPEANIIPTDSVPWPYPTLLRYNLFLGEEEKLKDYDLIYYVDIDMLFVHAVGDEIIPKEGIMAALHPMYCLKKNLWPPYEPNPESASYIKRPGRIINDEGQPRFMPMYFAGGFQGGRADKYIEAMKGTRKIVEEDLNRGYVPIWNDESAWNKYLSDNPPEVVVTPSYVYPDSIVKEYYEPLWGRSYQPRLMTLTKKFTTSKEGGEQLQKIINSGKPK